MSRPLGAQHSRLQVLALGTTLVVAILGARVAVIGLARDDAPAAGGDALAAHRGAFWDRDGILLATESYDRYDVTVDTALLPDPAQAARSLGEILGRDPAELEALLVDPAARWVNVAWRATPQMADAIAALGLEGVATTPRQSRVYPLGDLTAHVTGFVDMDIQGHGGVEGYYHDELLGTPGRRPGTYRTDPLAYVAPRDGTDLILTIDADLQAAARAALEREIAEQRAVGGTVIVLDPATGALLASVSLPDYDPNRYSAFAAEPRRFIDPAIGSIYPPGSVIKPFTLAAGIDAGLLSPGTTYDDVSPYRFGGIQVYNPDRMSHGVVTMQEMLQLSLNVGAAHVAGALGPERFDTAMAAFGFGAPTGIDLAGEVPGTIYGPSDEGWSETFWALSSFGQGMAATPIQVASAMAVLANDGRRMVPHVVAARIGPGGVAQAIPPRMAAQVISPATARTMRGMLAEVVASKTTEAAVPGYEVAGKTGTSEVPSRFDPDENETIASFCGFLPASAPRAVICVKVDLPQVDTTGVHVAAPLFRAVAEAAVQTLDIAPRTGLALAGGQP